MHFDVERQLQLGGAPQALAQNLFLDLELVVVAGMLVVAAAAGSTTVSTVARANPCFCSVREASTFSPPKTKGMNTALPRPRSSAGRRARPSLP